MLYSFLAHKKFFIFIAFLSSFLKRVVLFQITGKENTFGKGEKSLLGSSASAQRMNAVWVRGVRGEQEPAVVHAVLFQLVGDLVNQKCVALFLAEFRSQSEATTHFSSLQT